MRLTIEITEEQHRYMKTSADMEGKTIHDYVLDRAMLDSRKVSEEDEDIKELMEFLKPRMESVKRGEVVDVSIEEIIKETICKSTGMDE